VEYFKKCKEDIVLSLPILDKVIRKTLCLQDYKLSDGHVRGLAQACSMFNHTIVNRILLSNCGISGDQFALILEGIKSLKDFKSIVYRMNAVNQASIDSMKPLYQNRYPYHLEELKLIDCKITTTCLESLIDNLIEQSQIKKLALVNLPHSEQTFQKLGTFLEESEYLEELDLSWSNVK
jgi:Ran GTPase-activating protein (RanGAP) involved in mRNA processing and transport